MHWTLLVLVVLCGLSLALNAVRLCLLGSVRSAGLLICLGWGIQQTWWQATGGDSFALFVVCDAAIIVWFLTRKRRFDIAEKLIAASIPLTTGLGVYAWLHGGHTTESWWAGWWLVAGQMLFGLPYVNELALRVRAFNRQFNPWEHFNPRARHEDAA